MKLYRFGKQPYIQDLTGQGGLYHGGRWHQKGTQILYTAEHLSLAKLEMLANSPVLPVGYFALTLEVPDGASVQEVKAADLPLGWDALPYLPTLAAITEAWIRAGEFSGSCGCRRLIHRPSTTTCSIRFIPSIRSFASSH